MLQSKIPRCGASFFDGKGQISEGVKERNSSSLRLGSTFHSLSHLVISAPRAQSRCLPAGKASEELVQRPKANMRRGSSIVQQHEPEDLRYLLPQPRLRVVI